MNDKQEKENLSLIKHEIEQKIATDYEEKLLQANKEIEF